MKEPRGELGIGLPVVPRTATDWLGVEGLEVRPGSLRDGGMAETPLGALSGGRLSRGAGRGTG